MAIINGISGAKAVLNRNNVKMPFDPDFAEWQAARSGNIESAQEAVIEASEEKRGPGRPKKEEVQS